VRPKLYRVSRIVVVTAFAIIMIWDLFAQVFGGTSATVSRAIWDFSQEAPWVVFLAGFFCGHLFWGNPSIPDKGPML
jgi:hypothetical protein